MEKGSVSFELFVQVAEGDVIDDATVQWPQSRRVVDIGTLKIDNVLAENAKEQK